MRYKTLIVPGLLCVSLRASAQHIDLSRYRVVDLTHAFNAKTLYWPTSPSTFQLQQLAYGPTPAGFFYSAYAYAAPEHGGTHLDAPIHFSRTGNTTDMVPLTQLIAPAIVIDISVQAAANADYRLTESDVLAFERAHGRIAAGTIVLLHTGWGKRWPDAKAYFGDDTRGDASKLRFPSYGVDRLRQINGLHRPSGHDGRQRPRAGESREPRSAAEHRSDGHRAADEDRRWVGRTSPGCRADSSLRARTSQRRPRSYLAILAMDM